jgi:hypothetical protein
LVRVVMSRLPGVGLGVVAMMLVASVASADPTLQRLEASCQEGEDVQPATRADLEVTSTAPGRLMIHVRRYVANCAWHAAFTLRTRGHSIELVPVPMPANAPMSRCICYHDIRYRLEGLARGEYRLRVKLDGWGRARSGESRGLASGWAPARVTVQ